MKFEQFNDKHRNLNIRRDELLRKWNIKRFEEEQQRLFEAAAKRLQAQSTPPPMPGGTPPNSGIQSQIMVIKEIDASTFTYYVFNYDSGTINGPHDTGISVADYEFGNSNQYIVNKKGYLHRFFNSSTNDFALFYVSATGEIIETVTGNTSDLSINVLEGRYIVAWDYDLFTIWIFDGEKVYTDSTTVVGVDGYSLIENWNRSNSDGFFLSSYTDIGGGQYETKIYQWGGSSFSEIYSITHDANIDLQLHSWAEANKLFIRKYDNNTSSYTGFIVIDSTGNELQNVELDVSTYTSITYDRFGTDKCFLIYYNSGDSDIDYKIYAYDAGEDLLLETTLDRTIYTSFSTYSISKGYATYYDYIIPENCYLAFYHQTGNYGYGMTEYDYFKFVGFFEGESDFVIADFADDENKYAALSNHFTNNVFLLPTEDGGDFSLLKFDSTGTLTNLTFTGIAAGDATGNINSQRIGDKLHFNFLNDDDSFWYAYIIDSNATEYIYLDAEISNLNYEYEYDTIIVRDQDNDTAWYFNSLSTDWTSTNYYLNYNNQINYTSETRYSNGIISGFTPNRIYYFNDEGTNYIDDGGDDMYDGGNYLNTDLGTIIPYTHTQMDIANDSNEAKLSDFIMDGEIAAGDETNFGIGSSYFTNLYPGLFVMSASNVSITEFYIDGELGADGDGQWEIYTYTPTGYESTYTAYIKRLWNTGDPTVNQIFIVDTDGTGITHTSSSNTDDDIHTITGLGDVTKIHYLLFAKADGGKATNTEITNIINSYLTIVDDKTLTNVLTDLNANFTDVTDNLPSTNSVNTLEIYKRDSIQTVSINTYEDLDSGKDVFALWYYDPERDSKITLKMYDYSGTLLHTIETDDEIQDTFNVVESGVYLRTRTKYFDGSLYYVDNYYHLSRTGTSNVTVTVEDETSLYRSFNDIVWWD